MKLTPTALSRFTRWTIAIGILLRVVLAGINSEANDDHLPVIRTIAFDHRFPAVHEQWESFQPKLYHTTVALVLRAFDIQTPSVQIHIAEIIACLAGLLTLFVAIRFFRESTLSPHAQSAAIAFVSLNPALIGISAQATNDSFVILFGSVALASGAAFFRDRGPRDFAIMTAAAVGAGLSKGNGLVTILACLLILLAATVLPNGSDHSNRVGRMGRFVALFALLVLPTVWFLTPLHTNLREAGTPFVTNWPASPLPPLLHEAVSPTFRPGVTSVVYGLLTFRFTDLLRHPYNTHGRVMFNPNRTSLWTQLYAHTFFLHFDTYPPSWMSIAPLIVGLGRMQFVLALLPAVFLLLGLGSMLDQLWMWARRVPGRQFDASTTLMAVTAIGYLAFLAVYAVVVRDYSVMKAIFVFPAILAYTFIAAREYDVVVGTRAPSAVVPRVMRMAFYLLLTGFFIDVLWIIVQLTIEIFT